MAIDAYNANRGTGRTQRMLLDCIREAAAGKNVVIVAADKHHEQNLEHQGRFLAAQQGREWVFGPNLRIRVASGLRERQPGAWECPGAGTVRADHHTLEMVYGAAIQAWLEANEL